MYSPALLDHFENPRNAGELPDATVQVRAENPVCADTLELAFRVEQGVVSAVRFLAKGCVPSMACASWLTTAVEGRTIDSLASITAEQVENGVGGVPSGSSHAAQLAVDALRQALRTVATAERGTAERGSAARSPKAS